MRDRATQRSAAHRTFIGSVLLVVALAIAGCSGCGGPSALRPTATLRLRPVVGSVVVLGGGRREVCPGGVCSLAYPRGSVLLVELRVDRPGRPRRRETFRLRDDMSLRGAWYDRSGERLAGGLVLGLGLAGAAALVVGGVVLLEEASSSTGACIALCWGPELPGGLILGLGVAVALAAGIAGPVLLVRRDGPVMERERFEARITPWVAPLANGAAVGLRLDLQL